MYSHANTPYSRPTVALADYDFLRSIYEILLRAPVPNLDAINAAFESLEAAQERLRLAHQQLRDAQLDSASHWTPGPH